MMTLLSLRSGREEGRRERGEENRVGHHRNERRYFTIQMITYAMG